MGSASWLSTGEGLRPVGESGPEEGGSTGGTVPETQADLRYLLPSEPCGFEATYLELASAVKEQYPGIEIDLQQPPAHLCLALLLAGLPGAPAASFLRAGQWLHGPQRLLTSGLYRPAG